MRAIVKQDFPVTREEMDARRGDRASSRGWASTTRPRSSTGMPDARVGRSTARASSSTSAAARTCRAPARTAPSSSPASPAPTGAATSATRCCSASTAPRSPARSALEEHLARIEEAKQRDHRKLGKELDLFTFDAVAPGSPFFHPKGAIVYNKLVDYVRGLYRRYGYDEVITPQMMDVELWKRSGHYDNYRENMYFIAARGARVRGQADELPVALPDLRRAQALLPRAADPLRRLRPPAPRRALGHAARPDPGAQLLAGRRPHLLHAGADRRRDQRAAAHDRRGLHATSASTSGASCCRPGRRSRSAATRCGSAPRARWPTRCAAPASTTRSTPATAPSTARRSTSSSSTRSSAPGSWPPSSSTSARCPSAST